MTAQTTSLRATTNRTPKRSIAAKLALLVTTAVITAAVAMSGILLWLELSNYAETKSRTLIGTANVFATATARATATRNQGAAYQALKAIANIPDLRYARVEIGRGQILAVMGGSTQLDNDIRISDTKPEISPLELLSTHSIQVDVPIVDGGVRVGKFVLVADTSDLGAQLWASFRGVLTGAAIALICGLCVASRLQRGLSRPLLQLNEAVWRICRNHDFADRVKASSDDEVGLLIDGFNAMLTEIEERDMRLEKYRRNLETEVTERTQDLKIAKDAAESANAAKSDFLATMSHEIRTPMNGVMVMAELLAASDIPDRHRRYAEVISKSGQSLLAIINDILDFSKIESGKLELERLALDPAELVEDVTSLFSERAREKGIDLVAYVAPATPQLITGDSVRINQVIGNLVNNALKFTEAGSVVLKVAPDRDDPTRVRFAVSDTGVGIRAHKLKDIFGAFTQADQSTTRRFGGTGLGLAISKRLIDAMDGDLSVKSVYGRGSTFSFSIPIGESEPAPAWPKTRARASAVVAIKGDATRETLSRYLAVSGFEVRRRTEDGALPAADVVIVDADMLKSSPRPESRYVLCLGTLGDSAALQLVSDGRADAMLSRPLARAEIQLLLRKIVAARPLRDAASSTRKAEISASCEGWRVLVADDTAINREVAIESLARLGAVATTAENGLQAVAAAQSQSFDAVLMDVSMPELDGFEATRRIREIERHTGRERSPIVAVTAHVVGSAADAWRQAGMDAVLHKPFTLKSLAECLARVARPGGSKEAVEQASDPVTASETMATEPQPNLNAKPQAALNEDTLSQLELVARGAPPGFLRRVARLYVDNAPKSIEEMQRALAEQDVAAVGRAAHALKSMSLNIGADNVAGKAAEIERRPQLHAPAPGIADIEELQELLNAAINALQRFDVDETEAPAQQAKAPARETAREIQAG